MHVNTVEQFKILEFIKLNFDMDCVSLELVDSVSIRVFDCKGDNIIFRCEHGKIVW